MTTCKKCGAPGDLGDICRPCYRQRMVELYADIPDELQRITDLARELRSHPATAKRIAGSVLKRNTKPLAFRGREADIMMRVKRCLDGPFGPNLEAILMGWWVTNEKANRLDHDTDLE